MCIRDSRIGSRFIRGIHDLDTGAGNRFPFCVLQCTGQDIRLIHSGGRRCFLGQINPVHDILVNVVLTDEAADRLPGLVSIGVDIHSEGKTAGTDRLTGSALRFIKYLDPDRV